MAFQHVPTLQSTGRQLLTPPLTRFSRMLACAYFPLLPSVPPAPRLGGHRFVVQYAFLGSITAASGRFLSFRLPNRGDIVPSGVFGVFLPSVYHRRFRSPSFVQATEQW